MTFGELLVCLFLTKPVKSVKVLGVVKDLQHESRSLCNFTGIYKTPGCEIHQQSTSVNESRIRLSFPRLNFTVWSTTKLRDLMTCKWERRLQVFFPAWVKRQIWRKFRSDPPVSSRTAFVGLLASAPTVAVSPQPNCWIIYDQKLFVFNSFQHLLQ